VETGVPIEKLVEGYLNLTPIYCVYGLLSYLKVFLRSSLNNLPLDFADKKYNQFI
jgi:hypothetical protein